MSEQALAQPGALGRADAWGATAAYGAAHVAKSLFWYGGEVVFAYFLTRFAGLAPATMGWVLAIGLLVSAGLDVAVGGALRDRISTAAGAGRLQFVGAIAASAGLLAFLATPYVPPETRWLWALATGIVFRAGFAVYDVPQNALMSLATREPQARARVAGVRIAGSGLAVLLVACLVGPMIAAGRAEGPQLIVLVGLGAAVAAVASARVLSRTVRGLDVAAPRAAGPAVGRAPLAPLAPYLAMMVAMMVGPPLFQKLEPYFAADVLGSARWGGLIIVAAGCGIVAGQPFWVRFPVSGRGALFRRAALLQGLGALVFLTGSPGAPPVLALGAFLFGLGNGGLGVAKWAAFSDAAARAWPQQEASAFALFTALGKLSLALSVAFAAAAIGAAAREPQVLAWTMSAGPLVGAALMWALSYVVDRPGLSRLAASPRRGRGRLDDHAP